MDQKVIDFNKSQQTKELPKLQVGDIVRVHKKIKEGDKERVQVFKGLIIAIKGMQSSSPTITVRRESQKIGVEVTFPIYMPTVEKIEILRHSKVRRSKIYYMRERSGKSAKMKAIDVTKEEEEMIKGMNQKPEKKKEEEK
ncbi:50S ribosomal protein L19 [bacterium]|jgi:large subunit ribosomal protein L19|nr:50S ribosomal protein L19 [bacterium]MBT4250942.1 50S ribosomal protein L19 [bacterium]MBT4597870.1 50S ribosomal protein L19 [bacterium]MBT6753938.1 50S ribosomal protein L19 [bacterium]MBT7037367.1 50S ribosomal protein L19 [bacterium]